MNLAQQVEQVLSRAFKEANLMKKALACLYAPQISDAQRQARVFLDGLMKDPAAWQLAFELSSSDVSLSYII